MHLNRKMTVFGAAMATTALTLSSIGVAAQDEMMESGYTELDAAMGADQPYAGTRVVIRTQWVDEGPNFEAVLDPFREATGIDVEHISLLAGDHETQLLIDIEGGSPPDMAVLAQPAAVVGYGSNGRLVDIASILDVDRLRSEFVVTAPLYEGENGEQWAIPYKVDVKSTVWYPIEAFAAAGYELPETWDDLIALSDQIITDGNGAPWCIGIGASDATGWVVTDWVEDVMLRTAGPDVYQQWIDHEIPFNAPEVKHAFDLVGQIFFTDGYVFGGYENIVPTQTTEAMDPMWGPNLDSLEAPDCWMQKQALWYSPDLNPDQKATGEPSEFVVGEDLGVFYFPPIDAEQGNPALGSGDGIMVFNDRPEVRALAQYLATPEGIRAWVERGALAANQTTPAEWYEGSYKSSISNEIVSGATAFGFDASDIMPETVGKGTFWTEATKWVEDGGTDTDEILQAIEDSWPD